MRATAPVDVASSPKIDDNDGGCDVRLPATGQGSSRSQVNTDATASTVLPATIISDDIPSPVIDSSTRVPTANTKLQYLPAYLLSIHTLIDN